MTVTPVLSREEYVEQAYFFRALRERQQDGRPTQEILAQLREELLATTRLPLAVGFMLDELKHSGQLSSAMLRLAHYFTRFQAHVVAQTEEDRARFTFAQALLILEREAAYKAAGVLPAGLFIYQLETLSRNQLGYLDGLISMEGDGAYDDAWREFVRQVRVLLGIHDIAELVYLRSEFLVAEQRMLDPAYESRAAWLFDEKAGRIAAAHRGRDPNYLFATLQRQLGFPEVPRPPRADLQQQVLADVQRKLKALEQRCKLLEGEIHGKTDPSLYVSKPDQPPAGDHSATSE